ncbi:TOMM system kinase/cyclase fusion protein [Pseudoalteromonas ulvae]|uniref:TOMM system kinase/cyclase fusion protein n=1 Tax=Pseudoalteromonas ulvae TaxID=107327 RepID=A0A244CS61_PSEDV|nr:TOMM system kinase/cyclase fusion protein [Pseudoalteromonas ulvae]OUL58460.1 TOMM system kinase/cyclase fusion protein [Pseudoalteromonas ulvae]
MNVGMSDLDPITLQFNSDAYQLIEKIGEGGFASVYRAVLLKTGQEVAIKFLNINTDFDAEKKQRYIDRFERETLLVSRLQHPNIVRLLDKGRSNDHLLYAVFEYVQGQTLKQVITQSGALKPVVAAEIMTQVLDALAHAHQLGVIHRDIKPANIMLTQTGAKTHVKVLDFGIGTLINEAQHSDYKSITLTQETLGTPSYSAPEQLRGEPPTVKTDIYVWALVFIECLTGKPAMTGSSIASIFHKQLSQSNVPLSAALVGHPIAAILRRALQKKSHERTVTAQELFAEVSQLNFANLVGDLSGQDNSKHEFSETTLSDNTMVSAKAANQTSQTERKQITALAVTISLRRMTHEHFDSEVIEAIHHDLKNQCIDIAIRYGAYHVGSLGHQLLFYFGYPTVSDNDSRLSARTALEISSLLQKRSSLLRVSQGIEAKAKIGMHTGIITCFADTSPEGETANIALELSAMAEPEQILCSQSSQNILNCYLEFQPRQRCLVGINSTLQLTYLLTAERQAEAFGFLRGHRRNHGFFGRTAQLDRLKQVLETRSDQLNGLQENEKWLHIYGEAGIGKSRLVFEFRDNAVAHPQFIAQCLPEQQNNALFPILNLIQYKYSLLNLADEEAAQLLYEQALCIADNINAFEEGVATLLAWLNLPLPDGLSEPNLNIEQQRMAMFAVLAQLLLSNLNSDLKQVIIIEDLHWVDPISRDFIVYLVKNAQAHKCLIVTTSREALDETLAFNSCSSLHLTQLPPQMTRLFIQSLFGHDVVAPNVTDLLINRTDGIPLFIEELVDMLKKNQLVHKLNGIIDFVSPDKLDQVPSTLRDSLQQKLDSLVYSKETVQLAAAIGREFDYQLLQAASARSEEQTQTDLNELLAADLIIQHRKVEGDSYIFKHALVRDAAYESIQFSHKINHHQRLARAYQSLENKKSESAQISMHFELAQDYPLAIKYALNTAENAIKRYLYHDALVQYQRALTLNNELSAQLAYPEDDIRNAVAACLVAIEGWQSEKASHLLNAHEQQATQIDLLKSFSVIRGNWLMEYAKGNIITAHEINLALYEHKATYSISIQLIIYEMLMQTSFCLGEFACTQQYYDEFELLLNLAPVDSQFCVENFGTVPTLTSKAFVAGANILMGNTSQAEQYIAALNQETSEINLDELSSAVCGLLNWLSLLQFPLAENKADLLVQAQLVNQQGLALAKKVNNPFWLSYNTMHQYVLDYPTVGCWDLTVYEQNLAKFPAYFLHRGLYFIVLGHHALALGRNDIARQCSDLVSHHQNDTQLRYTKGLLETLKVNL